MLDRQAAYLFNCLYLLLQVQIDQQQLYNLSACQTIDHQWHVSCLLLISNEKLFLLIERIDELILTDTFRSRKCSWDDIINEWIIFFFHFFMENYLSIIKENVYIYYSLKSENSFFNLKNNISKSNSRRVFKFKYFHFLYILDWIFVDEVIS